MFKNMNVNEQSNNKFLPSSVYLKDCLSFYVYCYHGALVFFLLLLANIIMLISNALADGNIGIMFQNEENQLYQRQFDGWWTSKTWLWDLSPFDKLPDDSHVNQLKLHKNFQSNSWIYRLSLTSNFHFVALHTAFNVMCFKIKIRGFKICLEWALFA